MHFVEGQGILGKIKFVDGTMPRYARTYLIVDVRESYIEVLNVSSIKGKERKLAFSTNKRIKMYNPPFLKPSFVKLDSLVRVNESELEDIILLNNGRTLEGNELKRIKELL